MQLDASLPLTTNEYEVCGSLLFWLLHGFCLRPRADWHRWAIAPQYIEQSIIALSIFKVCVPIIQCDCPSMLIEFGSRTRSSPMSLQFQQYSVHDLMPVFNEVFIDIP